MINSTDNDLGFPPEIIRFIGKKWVVPIFKEIESSQQVRFSEFKQKFNITSKVLSEILGEMKDLGFIDKQEKRSFPPSIAYKSVKDLRRVSRADPAYPPILFVYQGTVPEGRTFFARFWPDARAVADAPRRLYAAFGFGQGGSREMFGPRVWFAGARAALKGKAAGKAVGDPRTMPGLFLVKDDAILWRHRFRHAGDHPDFACIPNLLRTGDA